MKWIFFLGCLTCFCSCAPDAALLEGSWRICGYYQDGQSISAPFDSTNLVFHPDQTYEFQSIGYYREKGSFRTSFSYLLLQDSTRKELKERALKILYLSGDTLKLKMQRGDNEQVLFFSKMN